MPFLFNHSYNPILEPYAHAGCHTVDKVFHHIAAGA